MANKKAFTDASLSTLVEEIKNYADDSVEKAQLITIADIDAICGSSIVNASEVTY